MAETIIGLLFLFIVFVSSWLMFFYSKRMNCKESVDKSWQRSCLLFHERNVLLKDFLDLISAQSIVEQDISSEIQLLNNDFIINQKNSEIIVHSRRISSFIKELLISYRNNDALKDDDSLQKTVEKLENIEEQLNKSYCAYNNAAAAYNKFILSFPNSAAASVLGIKSKID